MRSIGFPELLVLLGAAALFGLVPLLRSGGMRFHGTTLVLRKFRVDESGSGPVFIDIVGRASGFVGWLLTVLGIDAETSCTVTGSQIAFRSAALSGQIDQDVPIARVSSTHCGYSKPIWMLMMGLAVALIGLIAILSEETSGMLLLLIGVAFVIGYALSKRMIITVETSGGMVLGLAFKRSIIENVAVDMAEAQRTIAIINRLVAGTPGAAAGAT